MTDLQIVASKSRNPYIHCLNSIDLDTQLPLIQIARDLWICAYGNSRRRESQIRLQDALERYHEGGFRSDGGVIVCDRLTGNWNRLWGILSRGQGLRR